LNHGISNLHQAFSRVKTTISSDPRILSVSLGFGLILFLLSWSPVIGEYLITDGWRNMTPDPIPFYGVAHLITFVAFFYALAFTLAGMSGYVVAEPSEAEKMTPLATVVQNGCRFGHQLLGMFVIVFCAWILASLLLETFFIAPHLEEAGDPLTALARVPPGLQLLRGALLLVMPFAALLFVLLWSLEMVRGRGWSKAAMSAVWAGLKQPEILFIGSGLLALALVVTQALFFLRHPVWGLHPIAILPLSLLLAGLIALALPPVLICLHELAPAELPPVSKRPLLKQKKKK